MNILCLYGNIFSSFDKNYVAIKSICTSKFEKEEQIGHAQVPLRRR